MKSKDWQLTNLELSKRLKELGIKQESLWYWFKNPHRPRKAPDDWILEQTGSKNIEHYSAFTVAELGEILPSIIEINKISHTLYFAKFGKSFEVHYRNEDCRNFKECVCEKYIYTNTEANARAKMLIYLLEKKLI